jgi:hypothetical protein
LRQQVVSCQEQGQEEDEEQGAAENHAAKLGFLALREITGFHP